MKLTDIFEDVHTDNSARELAQKITEQLFDEVETNDYNNFERVSSETVEAYYISLLKLFGYDLSAIPEYMHHVKIIVRYENHPVKGVSAGIDQKSNVHLFLGEYEGKRLPLSGYVSLTSTVVHELIHVIDNSRIKGKTKDSAAYAAQGDFSSYVNDPMEMNAHYHQMIHELEDRIKKYQSHKKNYPLIYNSFLSTPDKFIEHALTMLDNLYVDSLTDENLKKFKKRIYQYYEYVKDSLAPEQVNESFDNIVSKPFIEFSSGEPTNLSGLNVYPTRQ